jgi:cysteine desulfurase
MPDIEPIYLDYAATTPVDQRVFEAMQPYFTSQFGNPSSIHYYGQRAEAAVEKAREVVAGLLGCEPREILFTSCGSESDNLALRGTAQAQRARRQADHLLITPVEHHAVSHTALALQDGEGFEVEYLPVDANGLVAPSEVARRLRPTTAVVSVIYANNEIGSINPLREIGQVVRAQGVPFHSDAVQAGAHLPLSVQELQVDLLALGAHKFYGPKGVGVLFRREGVPLTPTLTGGGQEFGLRAGTQNVPYIVGFAEALRLAQQERLQRSERLASLRDRLIKGVLETVPQARLTGHPTDRLPNHASFVFRGVDGNALLMHLDAAGFACSSGSACKTGNPEPSEVLLAMGLEPEWALGSLRVSLGNGTRQDHIEALVSHLPELVARLRGLVRQT